jgi:hypothetical protein
MLSRRMDCRIEPGNDDVVVTDPSSQTKRRRRQLAGDQAGGSVPDDLVGAVVSG